MLQRENLNFVRIAIEIQRKIRTVAWRKEGCNGHHNRLNEQISARNWKGHQYYRDTPHMFRGGEVKDARIGRREGSAVGRDVIKKPVRP